MTDFFVCWPLIYYVEKRLTEINVSQNSFLALASVAVWLSWLRIVSWTDEGLLVQFQVMAHTQFWAP